MVDALVAGSDAKHVAKIASHNENVAVQPTTAENRLSGANV